MAKFVLGEVTQGGCPTNVQIDAPTVFGTVLLGKKADRNWKNR